MTHPSHQRRVAAGVREGDHLTEHADLESDLALDHGAGWPALTYESRPWKVSEDASRSARRKHAGPYDAAVVPPISTADLHLPGDLLADLAEAEAAVGRFDEYVSSTLGGHTGNFAPISTILLRTESASSSQIENLTVGARQIALAELGEGANRNASIVTSNVHTMEAALALADRLDRDTLLQLHATLLRGSDPEHAGRLREEQVWIGGSGIGPHRASFVPPHHERVEPALDDLFDYLDRDDIPVLAQAAIAHAQFETIHPFTDGNGRTGRALVHALLTNRQVTTRSTVPISAGLLRELDGYFSALTAYRQGNPEPIVDAFCAASRYASVQGRGLVSDLSDIRRVNADRITARADSVAHRINEVLIGQPVINTAYVVETFSVSQPAANRAIDHLTEVGVLVETSNRGRNRVWQSNDVLAVLDAFAAGIRRSPER